MLTSSVPFDVRPTRVLVFARSWLGESLAAGEAAALRDRLQGMGAELIVVGARGAWAIGEDLPGGEFRDQISADLATTARLLATPGDAVFLIDQTKVLRVAHGAGSLVEAVDAAIKVLVTRRLSSTTLPSIPLPSLHRWVEEHAS